MPSPTQHRAPYRIGHGYDLHRLEPKPPEGSGRQLVLGGIQFEDHPSGPISHSDGDAVLHAITDAILGALGEPDIGQLFPDSDARNEGADSARFVRDAAKRMEASGFELGNLDVTVICERPKLSKRKDDIISNVAKLLNCDRRQINLKGKTHEQVDAVGEGRAIEVHAMALLVRVGEKAEAPKRRRAKTRKRKRAL